MGVFYPERSHKITIPHIENSLIRVFLCCILFSCPGSPCSFDEQRCGKILNSKINACTRSLDSALDFLGCIFEKVKYPRVCIFELLNIDPTIPRGIVESCHSIPSKSRSGNIETLNDIYIKNKASYELTAKIEFGKFVFQELIFTLIF